MVNIEIPVSSADINLINVIFLQLVLVPVITGMTSKLAGFKNHEDNKEKESVPLESFDPPVIGGNLITRRGFHRQLMIAVRVSVVVAVGISNVGLGGRSRTRRVVQEEQMFGPGAIPQAETNGTQLQDRLTQHVVCNVIESDGKTYEFRSVINGECHREVDEFIHIEKLVGENVEFRMSIDGCSTSTRENRIIRKCANADFVCTEDGVLGDETDGSSEGTCVAVRYSEDEKYAWQCERAGFVSESEVRLRECRKLKARREDLRWWSDAYTRFKLNGMFAVFASAYGVSQAQNIEVEDGEEEVTIVSLLWLVCTAWIVLLVVVLSGAVIWKSSHNVRAVSHTERSLFRLLDDKSVIIGDNECLVTFHK